MSNKKAVSLMVAYSILIVIGIAISVIVFNYLKSYTPGETPECPQDVFLTIESAACSISEEKLNITLSNRGLFNISGAYIRLGPENREIKGQVNFNEEQFPSSLSPASGAMNFVFSLEDFNIPGGQNEVEVQVMMVVDGTRVACPEAITTFPVICS